MTSERVQDMLERILGYEDTFIDYLLDPIHGQVGVTKIENEVINTEVFSRLKNIKQLGFVSNLYPSATHTRFEHSVGTLFVTWEMLKRFVKNYAQISQTRILRYVSREVVQATRLAALLHDLGHGPFSHAIEDVSTYLGSKMDHDEVTYYLLGQDLRKKSLVAISPSIYGILNGKQMKRLDSFREELAKIISPQERELVLGILNTKYKFVSSIPKGFLTLRYFLHDLLKGDIGSDRVDYLLRDTYFTGLGHRFSLSELLDNLSAIYDSKRNVLLFAMQAEGRDAVELMLLTRYFHYQFIAHHPKNIEETVRLMCRMESYMLDISKKSPPKSSDRAFLEISLKNDWIEERLPDLPRLRKVQTIKLTDIRDFVTRYLFYRIIEDPILREEFCSVAKRNLTSVLGSFPSEAIVFHFKTEKPHIPILHLHMDQYIVSKVKKSVLIHDQSPFLIGLGRAYIENSAISIFCDKQIHKKLQDFLHKEPSFLIKRKLLRSVTARLDLNNLTLHDLLLISLLRLTDEGKNSFTGVNALFHEILGLQGEIGRLLQRPADSSWLEEDKCFDPYWEDVFPYPERIFNDLQLFDVCKMINIELVSVPGRDRDGKFVYRPSWKFTPRKHHFWVRRIRRYEESLPIVRLFREFYPKRIRDLTRGQ